MGQFAVVISEIKIKNLRGFRDITLPFNVSPNCANILVAPNGFGKSSISTAFQCATGNKLNASDEQKHGTLQSDPSELSICVDGSWLIADANKNEIADTFDVHVMKSGLTPKAKVPRINGVPIPRPYMELPSLDLGISKSKEDLAFDLKAHKAQLGKNAKVVPNFTQKCEAPEIRRLLLANLPSIDKLSQVKPRQLFNRIIIFAAGALGTKVEISQKAEETFSEEIEKSEHISAVMSITQNIQDLEAWLDRVLICYQAAELCKTNRASFKRWLEYGAYQASLSAAKAFISDINNAWVGAQVKERKGRVVVEFPEANALSNGQRDLLYFGCNMLRARQVVSKKPCIIVIDEVFDYLDDANIMVAQYFLSKMIDLYKREGREVFICLLTHLDPIFFKGYALRKQKTIYLQNGSPKVSNTMKKVVGDRENPTWKEDLEKYFLHYHPDNKDLSELFNTTFGLPKVHGRNDSFYDFLRKEWGKCLSKAEEYDPFAVCAHVRIEIERIAYSKLSGEGERNQFIDTHGTANKLMFCEAAGVQVPESCYLLGVIYNDALHQRGAIEQSSSIALKLRNIALVGVIKNALDW